MKQNQQKEPMQENTKDDSSDVDRVKQNSQKKEAPAEKPDKSKESEEAQKGHA
jgi:hypothetical protein